MVMPMFHGQNRNSGYTIHSPFDVRGSVYWIMVNSAFILQSTAARIVQFTNLATDTDTQDYFSVLYDYNSGDTERNYAPLYKGVPNLFNDFWYSSLYQSIGTHPYGINYSPYVDYVGYNSPDIDWTAFVVCSINPSKVRETELDNVHKCILSFRLNDGDFLTFSFKYDNDNKNLLAHIGTTSGSISQYYYIGYYPYGGVGFDVEVPHIFNVTSRTVRMDSFETKILDILPYYPYDGNPGMSKWAGFIPRSWDPEDLSYPGIGIYSDLLFTEVIIFDRLLTDHENKSLFRYYNGKYNIW